MNKKTFYITTPIFYPSGELHIGHVYTTSLAQVLCNYKKMCGYKTLFLTGVDEHGQKIEQKAIALGISPQKYVDQMTQKIIELWKIVDIKYDIYMRTTSNFHIKVVKEIFSELINSGVIYKSFYEGLYSIQDEEFFTKSQAIFKENQYYSPISNHLLEWIKEESYFFKMSKYSNFLLTYFEKNPEFVLPKKIVNELKNNFIKKGLEDLSVSRTSFKWGIATNEDPNHIIYVWIDALTNYITALGYKQNNDELFKNFWLNGDERVHIVGKEITRFHCIYWPIILKTLDLPLPTRIFSHGWIVTKIGKMSKSKNNVISPIEQINKYTSDVVTYYLLSQITMGEDGIYDENNLISVHNSDLANNYGNLLSRTIAMSQKNFKITPKFNGAILPEDLEIEKEITSTFKEYCTAMDLFDTYKAIKHVLKLSHSLNKYIDLTTPWKLSAESKELSSIISHLLNGIYAISAMLSPIMPKKMEDTRKQLNIKEFAFSEINNFTKMDNLKLGISKVIFQRIK